MRSLSGADQRDNAHCAPQPAEPAQPHPHDVPVVADLTKIDG